MKRSNRKNLTNLAIPLTMTVRVFILVFDPRGFNNKNSVKNSDIYWQIT
ncbi:hypothetical protein wVul_1447 [Wolbachia endosymbiont of Armadillidium vulgare str. wVulC]|nr:hypothetical protein wVul_1447 [Wolbachia endosymbiont of Armadillidium vulgare str. wVulC]